MKISGIRITVQRWDFADKFRDSELQIRVEMSDGQEVNSIEILDEDDLVSRFDLIWQRTGDRFKQYLKSYQAKSLLTNRQTEVKSNA